MNKPVKATFDLEKTNHKTPALIFFGLSIPVLMFVSMTRISHLEQTFVYNEEARLSAAKEELFKTGCNVPRQKYLALVATLEEKYESSSIRMKDTYDTGFKDHKLYSTGEQLTKGEKYVNATCTQALGEVAKLKRGSSWNFVVSNFFGQK